MNDFFCVNKSNIFHIINDNKTNIWLNDSFVKNNSLPIIEFEGYKLYKTIYFDLKNKSLSIIKENFPNGIGFRNFSKVNTNDFEYLKDINSHSIYFGSFSEIGIFAVSIIFFLFFMINNSIKLYLKNKEFLFLLLFFTYFIVESINTDLMSYKIVWIIVAISLYLDKTTRTKNDYS